MSIQADGEGKYSLTVSKGKYRVIKRGPKASNDFSKVYDFLSPLQKRIVDVSGKENPIIFNIEILLPTD
jgi:hypothetical protein